MYAAVYGMSVIGLQAHLIRVEVDVSNGLPSFDIVGLATTAVREARERVRSAIRNSGFQFPLQRITVNLAPADTRKEGSGLDLAIAMGILAATGQCPSQILADYVFIGELSLEGALRPVPGVLSMAVNLKALEDLEHLTLIVPPDNLPEAHLVSGLKSAADFNLADLVNSLKGLKPFEEVHVVKENVPAPDKPFVDWQDIQGQQQAKRALEVAAAGGHNVLMVGPPGSGKTLLAKAYAGILPPLSEKESMEVTMLYSIAGLLPHSGQLIKDRPFRQPHHTATVVGIIGGGRDLRPGELSLANHGVLFLDELPEFSREVLESLRQPLEDRELTVTRQRGSIKYPARISVIAAMNPCPCGFYGDGGRACSCSPKQIENYRGRVSGPLLDRFDIHIEVPRIRFEELRGIPQGESSDCVRERVVKARELQWARLGLARTNAEMTAKETKEYCRLSQAGELLLQKAFTAQHLSARAHDRILRVARTIADLAGSANIEPVHLAEALQYRVLDRKMF